jgi:hypothetical protein
MAGVSRAGDIATCLTHSNSGSTTVFANSQGVSMVDVSVAGGTILGPGSTSVFCEGSNVSVGGDSILPHGDSPHAAAKTDNASEDVFAG